jgi:hypothetical protein
MSENFDRRIIPQNTLEVDMLLTNPAWGTNDINPDLKRRLKKIIVSQGLTDEDGNNLDLPESEDDLWSLLSIFTRDLRLANLNSAEVYYCKYYLDLAHDFLLTGFHEPFTICLSRVASVTELSQSKSGFLRKRQGTLSKEEFISVDEKKKSFLNKNSNKGDYK